MPGMPQRMITTSLITMMENEMIHHAPFPVETNGPAHSIMLLDAAEYMGKQPDLKAIRRYQEETIGYIRALGLGELPLWHEIENDCPPCQSREALFRRLMDIYIIENDGSVSDTLVALSHILAEKGVTL